MTDTAPQQAFAKALAAFQESCPPIGKDQTAKAGSYSYDYADLASISRTVLPLLAAQGLAFTASPTLTDAGFVLRYALIHVDGHREGGDYPLPDPEKHSPQEVGSGLTYARRYAFTAVTGIAPGGEDDDGQKAASARSRSRQSKAEVEADPLKLARVNVLKAAAAAGKGSDPAVIGKLFEDSVGFAIQDERATVEILDGFSERLKQDFAAEQARA